MTSFNFPPPEAFFTLPPEGYSLPEHLLTQPEPRPQTPRTELHEVFEQLKWSVLDCPSEVQVFELDSRGEPQWQTLFENSKISTTDEAATSPPRSRLHITIQPLHSWWHWHDAEIKHLRPESLLIENTDGRPISVMQFMHAVHGYVVPLRKLLCRCTDVKTSDWPQTRFYYELSMGRADNTLEKPDPEYDVYLIEDTSEQEEMLKEIWSLIETRHRRKVGSQ